MVPGSVVYSHTITCPTCGLRTSGYLMVNPEGRGVAVCPRCGSTIVQVLGAGHIAQVPPAGFIPPGRAHVRASHYPGLYMQPKHAPRYALAELVRAVYSPMRAFTALYLSANANRALVLVVLFAALSTVFSVAVTEDMADVIGYNASDALELVFQGLVNWIVILVSFLIFAVVAAMVSREVFGGRGEKGATLTLVGYCYPWFVLLTIVLLSIFTVGFEGLNLSDVQQWTNAEMDRAIAWGALLLVVALVGFVWLLVMVGRAIGVANDVSLVAGALSAVLAGATAGIVSLVVRAVMSLPIGISF